MSKKLLGKLKEIKRVPERLFFNVNRAYREFRNIEPWDAPFNALDLFGKCNELRIHWGGI